MKKLLVGVLILIYSSCKTLSDNNNIKNRKKMEKINVKEFKTKGIESESGSSFKMVKNDTIEEMNELEDIFIKYTYKINSPYKNTKVYYKDNLTLKEEGNSFYMIPVGISKKYDKKGKIVEEKNLDEINGRIFSVEQLIDKMKKKFDINLTDVSKIGASIRYDPRYGYNYVILVRNYEKPGFHREFKVDVKNGEVLSDMIVTFRK